MSFNFDSEDQDVIFAANVAKIAQMQYAGFQTQYCDEGKFENVTLYCEMGVYSDPYFCLSVFTDGQYTLRLPVPLLLPSGINGEIGDIQRMMLKKHYSAESFVKAREEARLYIGQYDRWIKEAPAYSIG